MSGNIKEDRTERYEKGGYNVEKYEIIRNSIRIDDMKVDSKPNEDINEALIRCVETSGMSMAQFSRITGITQASIVRYRQKTAVPTLETIVISCIALRTNIFQALYLISIAGYNIIYSEDKKIYLVLLMLSWYFGLSVDEANDILIGLDMKPLVKKQTKKQKQG